MNRKKKYEKPVVQDFNDLTPALGLCATGNNDGGCLSGNFAGGTQRCNTGNSATGAVRPNCYNGGGAIFGCSGGSGVFVP